MSRVAFNQFVCGDDGSEEPLKKKAPILSKTERKTLQQKATEFIFIVVLHGWLSVQEFDITTTIDLEVNKRNLIIKRQNRSY